MDGRLENEVNFAAINATPYTPVLGIPGDDFLILLAFSVFLFPVAFVVTILWALPGLLVIGGVTVVSYFVVVVMLRVEMNRRPRRGMLYERVYSYLTPSKYPVLRG